MDVRRDGVCRLARPGRKLDCGKGREPPWFYSEPGQRGVYRPVSFLYRRDRVFPDDLEHSLIDVEIDMLSADTQSRDRDSQIGTADWFHSGAFPTAHFRATCFVDKGGGRYEAHARLTMRGVGRDVVLPFKLAIVDDPARSGRKRAKVTGRLDLLRTAWGIGQGEWADTDAVGDKVVVTVDLVATNAE